MGGGDSRLGARGRCQREADFTGLGGARSACERGQRFCTRVWTTGEKDGVVSGCRFEARGSGSARTAVAPMRLPRRRGSTHRDGGVGRRRWQADGERGARER